MAHAVRGQLIEVSEGQAVAFRLRRHLLSARGALGAEEVSAAVFGLHAQVHSCAELMWSARSAAAAPGEIRRLLWSERRLVKGWFMRGTLHLLPAADYRLYGAARADGPPREVLLRWFEISAAEFEHLMDAIPTHLGAEPLTRRELVAALSDSVSPAVARHLASGWGTFLKPLVRRGLLCFGPPRGQEVTFVLPSAWLGETPQWEPDAAVAELARRYLRAFGPASRGDFQRWAGIEPRRGRVAWSAIGEELAAVRVAGANLNVLAADLPELMSASEPHGVRLLGGFDTYLLGHAERSHLGVPAALRPKVWRQAGWISPVLLVGGRVAGVWSHVQKGGTLTIRVEPFDSPDRRLREGVAEEAERLGAFLEAAPGIEWAG